MIKSTLKLFELLTFRKFIYKQKIIASKCKLTSLVTIIISVPPKRKVYMGWVSWIYQKYTEVQ